MNRRIWRRPYLFEIVTVVNFLVIFAIVAPANPIVLTSLPVTLASFIPTLAGYGVAGVAIRAIVAWRRGQLRSYLRILRSPGWLVDSARLVVVGALMVHTYFWIKLVVPLLHPALFDQQLWDIDRAMFLGYSPNILFLEVFSTPFVLKAIDISYARIFFVSMTLAFVYFLSDPSRRLRIGFSTGNTLLWLLGAWLYLLIPSLGPAYRFPDIWLPFAYGLDMTQRFQADLFRNYQAVLRLPRGGSFRDVQLMLGIAAFPSLHVGFQTFVFLWMRRVWTSGEVIFAVFSLVILIGSVVTGWHYLIDGIAGIAMAIGCYLAGAATWRLGEWLRLRAAIRASR